MYMHMYMCMYVCIYVCVCIYIAGVWSPHLSEGDGSEGVTACGPP